MICKGATSTKKRENFTHELGMPITTGTPKIVSRIAHNYQSMFGRVFYTFLSNSIQKEKLRSSAFVFVAFDVPDDLMFALLLRLILRKYSEISLIMVSMMTVVVVELGT
jgi:hypothetical protein